MAKPQHPRQIIVDSESAISTTLAKWQTRVRPWLLQEQLTNEVSVNHINSLLYELAREMSALRAISDRIQEEKNGDG